MQSRTFVTAIVLVAGVVMGLGSLGPGRAIPAHAQSTPSPSASATSTPSPPPDDAPTEITLVFTSPPPSDATDPCHTGVTGKSNDIGDHDDILVCTFNSFGRPAPTDTAGYSLQWSLEPTNGSKEVGVRFDPANPPPEDTSGPSAMAHAEIEAIASGYDRITVTLLDGSGRVVSSASIDKIV